MSSDGYTVRRLGNPLTQFYIEYTDGERQLHYHLDNLVPGTVDVVRPERIGPWLTPHAAEVLSKAEQMLIAQRIVAAMAFLGDPLSLDRRNA